MLLGEGVHVILSRRREVVINVINCVFHSFKVGLFIHLFCLHLLNSTN
jgi:hypothetical protein